MTVLTTSPINQPLMNQALPQAYARDQSLSRLTIDLDALARNYLFLKKNLAAGVDCAAVVKADAYGLGATPIAQTLYRQGCRHFFVADIDEARTLLHSLRTDADHAAPGMPGYDVQVYVLDGPHGAVPEDFLIKGVVPVLNSIEDVQFWAGVAKQHERRLSSVLHIDTGMNRLGLSPADVASIAQNPDILSAFDLRYIMSHLACAEDKNHPMNAQQLATFQRSVQMIKGTWRLSLANSGGVFLGADYHFDLVRPGAALYGLQAQTDLPNQMQNVLLLDARVLQVRMVDQDGTVGYAATSPVKKGMCIATIAIGYADGYFRSLSNRGTVYIHNKACPVLGRVSMDSVIVDISHITSPVSVGDWAEVIGKNQSVDDLAAKAGTIGYEVLTNLGARLKRTYQGGI